MLLSKVVRPASGTKPLTYKVLKVCGVTRYPKLVKGVVSVIAEELPYKSWTRAQKEELLCAWIVSDLPAL